MDILQTTPVNGQDGPLAPVRMERLSLTSKESGRTGRVIQRMLQMGKIWGATGTQYQFFRDVLKEKWYEMLGHNFLLVMVPSTKLGCKQSLHLPVRDAGAKDHWSFPLCPDRTRGRRG